MTQVQRIDEGARPQRGVPGDVRAEQGPVPLPGAVEESSGPRTCAAPLEVMRSAVGAAALLLFLLTLGVSLLLLTLRRDGRRLASHHPIHARVQP